MLALESLLPQIAKLGLMNSCPRNTLNAPCIIMITAKNFIFQGSVLLSEKIKLVSGSYRRV
jgi:hypothetical protein